MIVRDLVNGTVQQITLMFPDENREATVEDALAILQTATIIAKAFVERELSNQQGKSTK